MLYRKGEGHMKVPKTIEQATRRYVVNHSEKDRSKILKWLTKHGELEEGDIGAISIVDTPKGDKQLEDGEYCCQWSVGYEGDSFQGYYYHQFKESSQYLKYEYEC
jgi:hypothetical protein